MSARLFPVLLTLAATPLVAQTPATGPPPGEPLAIVDVTLVPMDREELLHGQTVVVEDGRIVALGPMDDVPVPQGVLRIDGRGRYLMPGLGDMNVRLEDPNDLLLYLANGVTAVRNLGPPEMALRLRTQVETGNLPGPLITTAGATIDRWPTSAEDHVGAPDAEAVRRLVQEQAALGVDFVAVTPLLPTEVHAAAARAAREAGLWLSGDAPVAGGLEAAARNGQRSIDHLVNVLFVHFGRDLDPAEIDVAARRLHEAGIHVTTGISAFDKAAAQFGDASAMRRLMQRPEVAYANPRARREWGWGNAFVSRPPSAYLDTVRGFLPSLARGLSEGGVRLVLGTDANTAGNVPGFAVHDELRALVESGLTPYQALRTATVHAAELVGAADRFGTLAVGRRADLLLLEANPLDDVAHATRRVGVVASGRWFPEAKLQAGLADLAARYPDPAEAVATPFRIERPSPIAAGAGPAPASSR